MGAAKKFKHYPVEGKKQPQSKGKTADHSNSKSSNEKDKQEIEQYVDKIGKLLESDPKLQKKAALILANMINIERK